MLFWSFVLAFVLSILYYMSPVHNTVQIEDKPLADTMVAPFVNAHQMAKRLTYTDKGGVTNQCDSTDDSGKPIKIDCLDDEGNPIEVEDTSKREITFTYKQAMAGLTGGYLPNCSSSKDPACIFSGILSEGIAIINPDEIKKMLGGEKEEDFSKYNITSAFACITNVGTDGTTIQPYLTFDCQGRKNGGVGDYVITYMQAPHSDGIGRNELWRSGILRRTKGSHECGMLWKTRDDKTIQLSSGEEIDVGARKKYDKNSPYILDNSRRFTLSVPTTIGDVLYNLKDGGENYYLREDMESGYLLFCITPIDDIKASFEWKNSHGYGVYQVK